MRAWGDGSTGFGPADVAGLVAYVRQLGGVEAVADTRPRRWVAGDPALGARLFDSTCSGCHGVKGEGVEGPALNNPTLLEHATDAYFVETIKRGRRGTAMNGFAQPSPVHRTLSDQEIEAIVTFIRTWGGPS
jgi:mono/diheme cytochrome c family protein